ncbi:hypothetical protein P168DRAFT_58309 [Aspergillus campestris IBT 28561]|uniref:Uncharacterized protein n=1 Tax=Aspergillus campestris (strain IBT 28561) TaxID=1392248 RepID=A0A2I1CTS6_ASPC2|nr:uncharacterized protein P168DRAFT_58309 [Aspergillus campestris IBT 28561]PKY01030.1 hypothetical protein P168DRAFT_58309 [Aspergillus campestris IBT 28561]
MKPVFWQAILFHNSLLGRSFVQVRPRASTRDCGHPDRRQGSGVVIINRGSITAQ